ncbi:MAG: osmoprotectant transporter activator [Rhodocyclaceae bacterium]|nr:MAG: osmoprotectant transporter activator [Rhodocyclaceae bacterium]
MTDTARPSNSRSMNAVVEVLIATFAVFRDCQPLAIGVHKSIRERLPDIGAGQLHHALKTHTASTRYLKALSQGTSRLDLDGCPAGIVTPEQQKQALDTLRDRFRKQAERRKTELQAQEHQQKLLKLVETFNTR